MVIWLHRKVCHQILRIEASNPYNYLYLRKAHELVINLLDAPEDMQQHFKTFVPNGVVYPVSELETDVLLLSLWRSHMDTRPSQGVTPS